MTESRADSPRRGRGRRNAKRARDVSLILHIGLHKTASSYVQSLLGARRYDLLSEGVLFPNTGSVDTVAVSTREGAQSGHAMFARPGEHRTLVSQLVAEVPANVSTVLLSSEDFTLRRLAQDPLQIVNRFDAFGTVKIVLVLRRQDAWIESFYKQLVDQYGRFETRSFDEFLTQEGPSLLDFHARFAPWRNVVGPENFHVLSYDDLPGGAAIYKRILGIAGVDGSLLDEPEAFPVPHYSSVRPIDTLGLRILNSYRLESRDLRTQLAKSIYDLAPEGDIDLMTPAMREGIQSVCGPVNERIEAEWFDEPVPGFRFGQSPPHESANPPSGPEVVAYLDQVMSLCENARRSVEHQDDGE